MHCGGKSESVEPRYAQMITAIEKKDDSEEILVWMEQGRQVWFILTGRAKGI